MGRMRCHTAGGVAGDHAHCQVLKGRGIARPPLEAQRARLVHLSQLERRKVHLRPAGSGAGNDIVNDEHLSGQREEAGEVGIRVATGRCRQQRMVDGGRAKRTASESGDEGVGSHLIRSVRCAVGIAWCSTGHRYPQSRHVRCRASDRRRPTRYVAAAGRARSRHRPSRPIRIR